MSKKDKQNVEYQNKGKKTAQGSLPFEAILKDGFIQLDKSTYTILCRFENAPYLSQTESEQNSLYEKYISTLNGLSPQIKYQEIIYSQKVDTEQMESLIVPDCEGKNEYSRDYARVQKEFARQITATVTKKVYLLALSYTVTSKLDNPFNILTKAIAALSSKFQAMGSNLTQLLPEEVVTVLHELYNPYSSAKPSLKDRVTIKDIITPGDIEFKAKQIRLGDAYMKTYIAWSFGGTLDDAFITDLLQNECRVIVSKHVEHLPKDKAIEQTKKRLQTLEADRQDRLRRNKGSGETYIPLELESNIANCRELIEQLSKNEDLYRVTVVMGVLGRPEEELEEAATLITNKASEHYVTIKPLILQQEEALNSLMPYGKCYVKSNTLLLSREVGIMIPFSYPTFLDKDGIYYGKNVKTGEPVVINRKKDKNSNGFIFGKSGGGKSFYAKLEISAIMCMPWLESDNVIVVDPDGEFSGLAIENAENSEIIRLSSFSENVINPFHVSDYDFKAYGDEAINHRVHYILSFISSLKGNELTAIEKTVADRAATLCYTRYVKGGKKDMPTLQTFDEALTEMEEEEAKTLRLYIERYLKGSIKLFSGKTNVALNKKLTVFDLTLLGNEIKNTGMLALLSLIWDRVYENNSKGKWTWIYFDELHRYYRKENSLAATEIERLYAEIRKHGGIITSMTQHPAGVLASPTASAMLTNSQFVVMFEQDDTNIEAMAERLKLNADQRRLLVSSDTGEAVLRAHNSTLSVKLKYPKENKVYETITTDFKDRIAVENSL